MGPGDALRIAAGVLSLQRSQWRPAARIRERQIEALAQTLAFALESVPHYRDLGIDRKGGGPLALLAEFPVLTKGDVQLAGRSMIAEGADEGGLFRSHTSGSTGEPTVSWFDRRSWLLGKYALKLRRMLDCGLGFGSRVLIVSEADERGLRELQGARMTGAGWLYRQEYLSLRDPIARHVDEIRRLRPDALYAFPSWLADLMDHCEREGVELPPVRVVFTSSELLAESLRRRLADGLGARVCDVYGCTEFKEVAWQCRLGCYHVNHESVWVEIDANGALLLTTLVNRAAPLIRYRVGDLAQLDWVRCGCGREGPALSRIEGREVELLQLPDGRRLSPYLLTTAVEEVEGLRQYQFVQTAGDLLEMRFTALHGHAVDEAQIGTRLAGLLGDRVRLRLTPVSSIPRTQGGKRKVFVRDHAAASGC
jgi:phenylacetate-CoA ligase